LKKVQALNIAFVESVRKHLSARASVLTENREEAHKNMYIKSRNIKMYKEFKTEFNISQVFLLMENYYNIVQLSQIYEFSGPQKEQRPINYSLKRYLGCHIRKGEDGSYYTVKLHLLINLNVGSWSPRTSLSRPVCSRTAS
jgi:hypothetical protein